MESSAINLTLDAHASIIDLFDEQTKNRGESTAFMNMGVSLTYAQLYDASTAFAAYLQDIGLKHGARVAIMMPNLLQYAVAMIGILRAGMVVVNVNPLYTARELSHQVSDSGAEVIVVLANFAATVQAALPGMSCIKHIVVTEVGDLMGRLKRKFINFTVKYVKRMVPTYHLPHAVKFNDVLSSGAKLTLRPVSTVSSDLAFLQYTGGTTGKPKAAMLSHRNMIANILQCAAVVGDIVEEKDIVIAALPMYHIFSLTVCCLTFIYLHAHCLLITNPRHMPTFLKILKKHQVNIFVGLSTLFKGLMSQPDFNEIDFSNLKLTVSGGMAMNKAIAEEWQVRTSSPVIEGYGLTEASPVVSLNPANNTRFNGSIGLPVPLTDVLIRDENGQALPAGEVGELCLKGPQVMQGYWHEPGETSKVIDKDGWLLTGDMARIDEKGFIYIVDRKKDMILVSGFNVYPNEIEDILISCSGVQMAAVIGVPSDRTGEAIKAVIVLDDESLTKAEIIAYCKQHLTRYKIPKMIEFRKELPLSNVGKVLRRELK